VCELSADRAPDLNHVAVSGGTGERTLATAESAGVDQVEVVVVLGIGACRTRECERRGCRDDERNEHTSHTNTLDGGPAMRLGGRSPDCRPQSQSRHSDRGLGACSDRRRDAQGHNELQNRLRIVETVAVELADLGHAISHGLGVDEQVSGHSIALALM
jgi:hypothetical protein